MTAKISRIVYLLYCSVLNTVKIFCMIIKNNFMLVQCILFVVYYNVYIILLTKKKANG